MIPNENRAPHYAKQLKGEFLDLYQAGRNRGRLEGVIIGAIFTIAASLVVFYLIP